MSFFCAYAVSSLLLAVVVVLVIWRLCDSIDLIYAIAWCERNCRYGIPTQTMKIFYFLVCNNISSQAGRFTIIHSRNNTNESTSGVPVKWENVFFFQGAPPEKKSHSEMIASVPIIHVTTRSGEKRVRTWFGRGKIHQLWMVILCLWIYVLRLLCVGKTTFAMGDLQRI